MRVASFGVFPAEIASYSFENSSSPIHECSGTRKSLTWLAAIFGPKSDSSESFALTTQLNARLYTWEKYSTKPAFEWSLGLSLEDRDDSDQAIGFYTGPSVSLLDGNLVFAAAYHMREVERLADSFEVGDTIPDDLQDPLPMTSSNESGFLFSVTYKIR